MGRRRLIQVSVTPRRLSVPSIKLFQGRLFLHSRLIDPVQSMRDLPALSRYV